MSDIEGASVPGETIVSTEPVIAATPAPVSTEGEPAGDKWERGISPDPKGADKGKDEPAAEKQKPLSARQALEKAAQKLDKEEAKPTPEKSTPIKDGEQLRADDGKFASKDTKAEPAKEAPKEAAKETAKPTADAVKPAAETKAAPEIKAHVEAAKAEQAKPSFTAEEPPARFSPDAKKDWAAAPESVRAEVGRAVKELTAGFEKHRSAAERDNSIAEFHELATKGGTTVKEALTKYVNMENQLRADPIKGLELICQNAGMSLRDVAAKILNQTPEQVSSQTDATIRELRATVADLQKQVGGVTQTFEHQRTQTTQQQVEAFAAAHPRFEEIADDIAFFMKSGRTQDLAEAYALAERLNPAPAKVDAPVTDASSAPIKEVVAAVKAAPEPEAQTDKGSKSIAGSPTPGSNPSKRQPSPTIKDALKRAMAAAG